MPYGAEEIFGGGLPGYNQQTLSLMDEARKQKIAQMAQQGQLVSQGTEEAGASVGNAISQAPKNFVSAKNAGDQAAIEREKLASAKSLGEQELAIKQGQLDLQSEELLAKNSAPKKKNLRPLESVDAQGNLQALDEDTGLVVPLTGAKPKAPSESYAIGSVLDKGGNPVIINTRTGRVTSQPDLVAKKPDPSDSAKKAMAFGDKAEQADLTIASLEDSGYDPADIERTARTAIPGVSTFASTEEDKKYKQAEDQFINAVARDESGATLPPAEREMYREMYFSKPNEGKEVRDQKKAARALAVKNLKGRGDAPSFNPNPSYQPPGTAIAAPAPTAGPTAPKPKKPPLKPGDIARKNGKDYLVDPSGKLIPQ